MTPSSPKPSLGEKADEAREENHHMPPLFHHSSQGDGKPIWLFLQDKSQARQSSAMV